MTTQWAAGELITASKLNKGLFFRRDNIAGLEAVDTSLYTESYYCCYVYQKGIYYHDPASSVTADGYYIVQPTSGGGRWFLTSGLSGQTYADVAELKTVVTTGISYSLYAYVTDLGIYQLKPSSTDVGDDFSVIKPTTGTGRWHLFAPHTDMTLGVIQNELRTLSELRDRISDNDDGYIYLSASLSWSSISTISIQTQTVTCIGARVGDIVNVGMPELDSTNRISLQWVGVKSNDTITVTLRNNHTSSLTPSTGTWKFEIRRFN